jgi:hypothetical protein
VTDIQEEIAQMIFKLGNLKDSADNYRDQELAKACLDAMRLKWAALCKNSIIGIEIKKAA